MSPSFISGVVRTAGGMVVMVMMMMMTGHTQAQDDFFDKYGFAKVMENCLGTSTYHYYLKEVTEAVRVCASLSTKQLLAVQHVPFTSWNFYDAPQVPVNFPVPPRGGGGHGNRRPGGRGRGNTSPHPRPLPRPVDRYTPNTNPFTPFANPYTPDSGYIVIGGNTDSQPHSFFYYDDNNNNNNRGSNYFNNQGSRNRYNNHNNRRNNNNNWNNVNNNNNNNRIPVYRPYDDQGRGQLWDASTIASAAYRFNAALSNFSCVLAVVNAVDPYLRIKVDSFTNYYNAIPVDPALRDDLLSGVHYCRSMTSCIDTEKLGIPLPPTLQQTLSFIKCERRTRMAACLKHDIRSHLTHFDVRGLPSDGGRTDDVDKLVTVLVGSESTDDMELF